MDTKEGDRDDDSDDVDNHNDDRNDGIIAMIGMMG